MGKRICQVGIFPDKALTAPTGCRSVGGSVQIPDTSKCPSQRTSSPKSLEKCPIIEQNMAWKLGIYFFTAVTPVSRLDTGVTAARKFFPSLGFQDGVVREFFPGLGVSVAVP